MRGAWQPTPLQRHLTLGGFGIGSAGSPPPPSGRTLRVVVRDPGGIDCEAAKYLFLALRGMDASVWVTHAEVGTLQLTSEGRDTRAAELIWLRFRQGEELTFTATEPDAERALEACRVMLEAPLTQRRSIYRQRYR